jgi:hypothetical protein
VGLLGLCHAAYSATQHRNYLRLTEKEYNKLPIDIVLQTIASLLIACVALVKIVGKFKSINVASDWENKSWDHVGNRSSFYTFNHRGKFLFSAATVTAAANNRADYDELMKSAGIETLEDDEMDDENEEDQKEEVADIHSNHH